jgi:hypothetical protein
MNLQSTTTKSRKKLLERESAGIKMEKISSNMACTKTHAKMSKSSETRAAEDGDVVALQTRRIWSEIVSSFQVLTACTRKTYCTKVQLSAPPWPAQADDGSEDPPINLFSSQSQTRAETSWTTDLQRTRIDPNSKPVPPPPPPSYLRTRARTHRNRKSRLQTIRTKQAWDHLEIEAAGAEGKIWEIEDESEDEALDEDSKCEGGCVDGGQGGGIRYAILPEIEP